MLMEEIIQIPLGIYSTNCFLIKKDNNVIIVDPGKNAEKIVSYIKENEIIKAIILTHGHFDHIGAVDDLVNIYKCPVYMDEDDLKLMNHPGNKFMGYTGNINSKLTFLKEGFFKIDNFEFEVIKTPGHTDGSVIFLYDNKMFAGDTIFKESIGRTDLFSGNESKMKQSIKLIKSLNYDYIIYPGHGDITNLYYELENNPFYI